MFCFQISFRMIIWNGFELALDRNPELLHSLLQPVEEAVGTIGREAGRAARETLGPEGAVSQVTKDVGKTIDETVAPEGAVGQTLGNGLSKLDEFRTWCRESLAA
jgi:hypothetical protein